MFCSWVKQRIYKLETDGGSLPSVFFTELKGMPKANCLSSKNRYISFSSILKQSILPEKSEVVVRAEDVMFAFC